MKIQEGKFYRTRDGREDGPLGEGHPDDNLAEWADGPVRTVTRREVVPGQYGTVIVESGGRVRLDRAEMTADELRSAAMVFSQIAEALDDLD